ncbi:MAG: hypothetical protein OH318_00495 [Candidatus Parvarchaeota archaeon]|nr:hypothetical protein [Candidatus Rehaiarchaeum fermentans]
MKGTTNYFLALIIVLIICLILLIAYLLIVNPKFFSDMIPKFQLTWLNNI